MYAVVAEDLLCVGTLKLVAVPLEINVSWSMGEFWRSWKQNDFCSFQVASCSDKKVARCWLFPLSWRLFLFWKGFEKHLPLVVLLWVEEDSYLLSIRLEGILGSSSLWSSHLGAFGSFLFFRGGVLIVSSCKPTRWLCVG